MVRRPNTSGLQSRRWRERLLSFADCLSVEPVSFTERIYTCERLSAALLIG